MITTASDRDEMSRLTEEYGGTWGINHTRRLLRLVSIIGEGVAYNEDAVWVAAHLHDWGAYSPWAQKGVDHVVRSKQVAEAFLAKKGYPDDFNALVLECIGLHHGAGAGASVDALLFRDADALDFLGAVGVLRDFAKNPKDLRGAYEATKKRRETLANTFHFDKAKEMATERIQRMDELLMGFEQETFGFF